MTRVYPNGAAKKTESLLYTEEEEDDRKAESEKVLTVWRKSLLLNGKGFTVFDDKGDLVFRVDSYAHDNKGEIVLMDAAGKSLLTIRRKKLSLGEQWVIYEGENMRNPLFSVKKNINLLRPKSLLHVFPYTSSPAASPSSSPTGVPVVSPSSSSGNGGVVVSTSPKAYVLASAAYVVEGSYSQRCCVVYNAQQQKMAEVKQKECSNGGVAFGLDVFRLVVQPGCDYATAMALVILLEQMFGSKGSLIS